MLEVFGDFLFKKWSIGGKISVLILGLAIYFIGSFFWAISLKYEGLSKAVIIFTIFNIVFAILIGVLYFKEDLSITNRIGILLGIISVILMES